MTRINCIPVQELVDKHLLAEYRELPRVFGLARLPAPSEVFPTEYTLGTGHVKFFYNKLEYLRKRYEELYQECLNRDFKVTYYGGAWDNIPNYLMNDYKPTKKDEILIRERISERLKKNINI